MLLVPVGAGVLLFRWKRPPRKEDARLLLLVAAPLSCDLDRDVTGGGTLAPPLEGRLFRAMMEFIAAPAACMLMGGPVAGASHVCE